MKIIINCRCIQFAFCLLCVLACNSAQSQSQTDTNSSAAMMPVIYYLLADETISVDSLAPVITINGYNSGDNINVEHH